MKAKEFNDIKDALIRIGTNPPKGLTDRENIIHKGTTLGILMWLNDYYEKNKEE